MRSYMIIYIGQLQSISDVKKRYGAYRVMNIYFCTICLAVSSYNLPSCYSNYTNRLSFFAEIIRWVLPNILMFLFKKKHSKERYKDKIILMYP